MSIGVLASSELAERAEGAEPHRQMSLVPRTHGWDAAGFAKQQLQGLVRRVFFQNEPNPVRQIVISAIEPETDVDSIGVEIAYALANETSSKVALAGSSGSAQGLELGPNAQIHDVTVPLQRFSTRLGTNVWRLPSPCAAGLTMGSLHSYLAQIRKQFEYSILELPAIRASHQSFTMAEYADGIILLVSAKHTRRATARKMMQSLAGTKARILGTVLTDRSFPIPESLYQRL